MSIFKNRFFVLLTAAIIIVSSTLISTNLKLNKEFNELTDGFFTGVAVDGKKDISIHSQLTAIGRAAGDMAAIAERKGLDVSAFKEEVSDFNREILVMHDDISYVYTLYVKLLDSIMNTGYSLNDLTLSEAEEKAAVSALQAIIDAKDFIEVSAYNESVRQYINSLHFPTVFFAKLSGVDLPEYFA